MSPQAATIFCRDGRPCFASGRPAPFKPSAENGASLKLRFDTVAGGSRHGAGPATDVAGSGDTGGVIPGPHRTATVSARCRVFRPDVPPGPRLGPGPEGFSEKKPAGPRPRLRIRAARSSGTGLPSAWIRDLFRVLGADTPGVWYRIRTCYTCSKCAVLYPLS